MVKQDKDSGVAAESNHKLELRNWGLRNREGLRGSQKIEKSEHLKRNVDFLSLSGGIIAGSDMAVPGHSLALAGTATSFRGTSNGVSGNGAAGKPEIGNGMDDRRCWLSLHEILESMFQ